MSRLIFGRTRVLLDKDQGIDYHSKFANRRPGKGLKGRLAEERRLLGNTDRQAEVEVERIEKAEAKKRRRYQRWLKSTGRA